jgi:hypothetical protein
MWTPCEKLDCQIDRSTTTLLVCRLPLSLLPCASCLTHAEQTENRTPRVCLWPESAATTFSFNVRKLGEAAILARHRVGCSWPNSAVSLFG